MTIDEADEDRFPGSALILWVIQLLITVVASFIAVAIRPMDTTGCAPQCDFSLLTMSIWMFVGSAITLTIVTGVLLIAFRLRRRADRPQVWWIPLLGIILTILLMVVCNQIGDYAMLSST